MRHVRLELAGEAAPAVRELELRAFGCDQGRDGVREFELVRVTETDTEVKVIAGMVVPEGEPPLNTCYPHSGTISVELAEPLGNRSLINDTSYPPRPVPAPGDQQG